MRTTLIIFTILLLGTVSAIAQPYNQNPTQTVCTGNQPYFIDPGTIPGTTYNWSVSGGGTITSGPGTNNITINWTTPGGPYTVSVYTSVNGCDGTTQTVQVTVTNAPSATIAYTGSPFCADEGIVNVNITGDPGGVFSATPAGLSINATTGAINTNASTPGTYTVTYLIAASGGCAQFSTTATVTVNPVPVSSLIWHN